MKKTILSLLVMLVSASVFAQSRFMPITMTTQDIGGKQYNVLYDIVLGSRPDAYYVYEVAPSFGSESFLFVEKDGLTNVYLDREFWTYYYRKYLLPTSTKTRKRHRQHGPKPKINHEMTVNTGRDFIRALENLLHVATLSATDIDNPWNQLDGIAYNLYPLNRGLGMAITSQEPQENTVEYRFIRIMSDLMYLAEDGTQPDKELMERMKANYLEFLQYMPKGNDYNHYMEQLELFDIYQE